MASSLSRAWTGYERPVWGLDVNGRLELTNAVADGAKGSASKPIDLRYDPIFDEGNSQVTIQFSTLPIIGGGPIPHTDGIVGCGIAGFIGVQRNRSSGGHVYELVRLDSRLQPVSVIDSYAVGERNLPLNGSHTFSAAIGKLTDTTANINWGPTTEMGFSRTYLPSVSIAAWPGASRFGVYSDTQYTRLNEALLTCFHLNGVPTIDCYDRCGTEWIPNIYYLPTSSLGAILAMPCRAIEPAPTPDYMTLGANGALPGIPVCRWSTSFIPFTSGEDIYTLNVGVNAAGAYGAGLATLNILIDLNGDTSFTGATYETSSFNCTAATNTFTLAATSEYTCPGADWPGSLTLQLTP